MRNSARHRPWLVAAAALAAALAAACSSAEPTATFVPPTPTIAFWLPTPEPDDVLIENVRRFLSSVAPNVFEVPVDAEGDGRMADNCLEVLEGGPAGSEWSVEQRGDGQTLVRLRHSASLLDRDTGTWLAIPEGGVGTTPDSLTCNAVHFRAYQRDNPPQ